VKVIFRATDGTDFDTREECINHEVALGDAAAALERKIAEAEYQRRCREDFAFMVLCASKQNMSMYHLLRDKSIDNKEAK
jgi:hypothetical protein